MIHELKKGIHPRPCGMINLSNIISYGRGTLPNLIDVTWHYRLFVIIMARKTAAIERSESGNESGKAGELSI